MQRKTQFIHSVYVKEKNFHGQESTQEPLISAALESSPSQQFHNGERLCTAVLRPL